jgi:hypothetical protein
VTILLASGTAFAGSPADVAQAFEDRVLPANNVYGSRSSVTENEGVLYATTKCGGYVAIVLQHAYGTVTRTVLRGLTGSASPTSKQWSDAIERGATYSDATGTFGLGKRATIDDIASGDVFASVYELPDATGHTMIVDSKRLDATDVTTKIPGVPMADRWLVRIHDSTSDPHGATDSRAVAGDDGIGNGWIYVFVDPDTRVIIGWTWSTSSTVTFQTTDPMAPHYRPVVVGYLTGTGV